MSQRLTRKEIKRDQVAESVGSALEWIADNQRTIWIGVAALLAAILVGVGVRFYLERRAERAGGALAAALVVYQAPIDAVGSDPGDPRQPSFPTEAARAERAKEMFLRVEEEHASTDAADVARAYRAGLLAQEGDLEGARGLWQEFLRRQGEHMLADQVRINLMALDRQQGRGEALAEEIRSMLDAAEPPLPEDVLLYQLALTYDALGREEQAMDALGRILDDHPQSAYAAAARRRGGRAAGAAV